MFCRHVLSSRCTQIQDGEIQAVCSAMDTSSSEAVESMEEHTTLGCITSIPPALAGSFSKAVEDQKFSGSFLLNHVLSPSPSCSWGRQQLVVE